MLRKSWPLVAALLAGLLPAAANAQAKQEIKITRQPGIVYTPSHILESRKLIEKHAAALGVPDLKVEWINFAGGGAATDALLSGNVDIVNTGTGNMLLLWDRTKGGVKGIVATSALPLVLVTRNPAIKSLKDYGPADKIAVPTVKVSTQAILLQMAAEKEFGAGQYGKLDPNTVQLGHPDAAAALMNASHEVTSHFSAPPFVFQTLKAVPAARVILSSEDIIGGPLTVASMFTTTKFADDNPKLVQAIKAASAEAVALIKSNPREAMEIYKEVTKDRAAVEDLVDIMKQPGMNFDTKPQGTMKFAEHLNKTGTLKMKPAAWTDYFLPIAHDLNGN